MKIFYHKDWRGNFGDDLNIPFFNKYCPKYKTSEKFDWLYGIGTLLNDVHGEINNSIIFGSGFGYGKNININKNNSKIIGVRGPWTARKLNLDNSYVIGDPAFMIDEMFPGQIEEQYDVIALHHGTAELWDFSSTGSEKLIYLDPAVSIQSYVETIRCAKRVYVESLHAAILCCVFGKPFCPISITTQLEQEKWKDFYELIGVSGIPALDMQYFGKPLVRKFLVKGKVRRFIKPKFDGVKVSISDEEILSNNLFDKNRHFITCEANKVIEIKEKLNIALDKLRTHL